MMSGKAVSLERTSTGSFGFSILGGHGMKFPAVICEVDPGGPADASGKVRVGDRLLQLNGELLIELSSKDLVQRIRNAPNPSHFVLSEDEELRLKVLALLKKQERRAAIKQQKASEQQQQQQQQPGEVGGAEDKGGVATPQVHGGVVGGRGQREHRKVSPALSNSSVGGGAGEDRRKKKLNRIIEVEPSVNINYGHSGEIVQVRANRIIGRIEQPPDEPPVQKSPSHSPQIHQRHTSPPLLPPSSSSSSASSSSSPPPAGAGQDQRRAHREVSPLQQGQKSNRLNLEEQTSLHPHISSPPPPHTDEEGAPGLTSNQGTDTLGQNGAVKTSDSSGFDSSAADVFNSSSFEEKVRATRIVQDSKIVVTPPPTLDRTYDSGIAVPPWEGPDPRLLQNARLSWGGGAVPRPSLPENTFIAELTQLDRTEVQKRQREMAEELDKLQEKEELEEEEEGGASNEAAKDELVKQEAPRSPSQDKIPFLPSDSPLRERLMRQYSSSSAKRRSDPYTEAVTLARRLYMLDGFRRSEVAAKLADTSEFGQTVAKEYLNFFEFEGMSLVESLRQFLTNFSLTGESQERERVIQHFSRRYFECSPPSFPDEDTVHGLTVALLLLNTDLHADHGGHRMTFSEFVTNLDHFGSKIPREMLKKMYDGIKRKQLKWARDDDDVEQVSSDNEIPDEETERMYHVTIPGTFVEVEFSENAPLFKEGFVLKKNIMEGPGKKVSRGKRQWKQYYAYLKGFLLYFAPPHGELHLDDTSSAMSITHCLAMGAFDYHKKNSVLRVTTSDWHCFLLQSVDVMEMQQWIGAINKAAGLYSSPPLAAPISSSSAFQRPTFPLTPTRNTKDQQVDSHEAKVKSLEKELEEHQAYKPKGNKAKHSQLQSWFDKFEFLTFEINRFRIYSASLTSDTFIDFNAPLPSGLVPSPSISTLATVGTDNDGELFRGGLTPPASPIASRKDKHFKKARSPLAKGRHS